MPKLGVHKTKKITLPSLKDSKDPAWVEISQDIPIGWIQEIQGVESENERVISMLEKVIVDWNYSDDTGKKAPITKENVAQIHVADLNALVEALNFEKMTSAVSKAQKKS